MNRIARYSINLGVTFGLLALSLFFANKALASAPADLAVGMALQKHNVQGQVPLDYGATVNVVPKRTSNGIDIPIQGGQYNGNHLDLDGNGSPERNGFSFGVGPVVTNSVFGGTYYRRYFNNLVWCGNSVGVPNGEFELDVSVQYASGAHTQTISWEGHNYTGRWQGYWHFEGYGQSRFFNGTTARVPALNPSTTFVFFVFVEDPPLPIFTGTIKIEKHLVPGDNYPSPGIPPYNANVGITNNKPGSIWNPQGTTNPFTVSGIWVCTASPYFNDQCLDDPGGGSYNTYVDVPAGFEVARATETRSPDPENPKIVSCTGPNNTGRCKVVSIRVRDDTNGAITTVKFYFRVAPIGFVKCIPGGPAGAPNGRFWWRGTGIDSTNQAASPVVNLYEGSTLIQTIAGDRKFTTVPTTYDKYSPTYTGMDPDTNYDFQIELDNRFHDGATRTITPKLVTAEGSDLTLPNVTIPSGDCAGAAFARAWPWLQTSRGDVIASGQIKGQITSPGGIINPGARLDDAPAKEAEFLIISAVGGGSPFCSTYEYILTNTTATSGDCRNSTGVGYSTLNSYPLNTNNNGTWTDNAIEGVKKAIGEGDTTGCSKTQIKTSLPASNTLAYCQYGLIYKLTGPYIISSAISIPKGRVTIYVDGNLNIKNNIIYTPDTPAGIANIKDYPNLAIVVNGNVNIDPSVIGITALIYASGKIDTCSTAASVSLPTEQCKNRLIIKGSLVAKRGIIFGRSHYDLINRLPAESIAFEPQVLVYPPPGLDYKYFIRQQEGSYTLDPSEYQPRF